MERTEHSEVNPGRVEQRLDEAAADPRGADAPAEPEPGGPPRDDRGEPTQETPDPPRGAPESRDG